MNSFEELDKELTQLDEWVHEQIGNNERKIELLEEQLTNEGGDSWITILRRAVFDKDGINEFRNMEQQLVELKNNFIKKNQHINQTLVSDNNKLRERINIDIKKHDKDIVELRNEIAELKKRSLLCFETLGFQQLRQENMESVLKEHFSLHLDPPSDFL